MRTMPALAEAVPTLPPSRGTADSELLAALAQLAREWQLEALHPALAACEDLLSAPAGVEVAVLGRFKAGKSSFLNHLLGRAVLPISAVPLTAVITRLVYGERELARVRFQDGRVLEIAVAEIRHFVDEQENPRNQKRVAAVEVVLPEMRPFAPLSFVDTPGLDSALQHNTTVTLDWLPRVGASLVAISADAPLSERDMALLRELRQHTPRMALLITKADLLNAPQQAQVLRYVHTQLHQQEWAGLPVFMYSVKSGGAEWREPLLREFLLPLAQDAEGARGQIARHKLASLRQQMLGYLRVALAAATQAETARECLAARLLEERQRFGLLRDELFVLARQWKAQALEQSLGQLQAVQRDLQERLAGELEEQFGRRRCRLPVLLDLWREKVQEYLARELAQISQTQRPLFCQPLHRVQEHLTRTVRAFHDRLAGHVQSALGLSLPPWEYQPILKEPDAPPLDVSYPFDPAFSAVIYLLPGFLCRRPLERVLLRKARYEVEKNLSRLAADWSERVGAAIEVSCREAEAAAWNELLALSQMAAQTASAVPRLREQMKRLEGGRPV
ncbi:MAG: dynamin family protein [Verrucomicrobiae bacterium]|nr:dynamin family protein [Verrucomicrobiae bacterium]